MTANSQREISVIINAIKIHETVRLSTLSLLLNKFKVGTKKIHVVDITDGQRPLAWRTLVSSSLKLRRKVQSKIVLRNQL